MSPALRLVVELFRDKSEPMRNNPKALRRKAQATGRQQNVMPLRAR
jgi:hypothetical protein